MPFVIKTGAHKKVPVPHHEFAMQGFSCEIQVEPPVDVRESKAALRKYVEALFRECRDCVQAQIDQVSSQREEQPSPTRGQPRHLPMRGANGHGNGNSRSSGNGRQNGSLCSPKQTNFIKSLGTQAGFSYDDLGYMAEEAFGKRDLRSLTKKEASAMIDNLRNGEDQ